MTSSPSFADFTHLSGGSSTGPAHALEELITSCCTGLCPQYSQRTLELLASYSSHSLHWVHFPWLTLRLSTPIGYDTLRSFLHRSAHDINISIFRILSNSLKPFSNQQEIENSDICRERDFSTCTSLFQPWRIPVAKSLSNCLHPDCRHQHRHPHLQDFLHCSCTLQSKCKLLCKANHYWHTSIALFGKCCGIHSQLILSQLVELAPGQPKRS